MPAGCRRDLRHVHGGRGACVTVWAADRSTFRRNRSGRSSREDSSARTGGKRIRKPARAWATPGIGGRRWASSQAARRRKARRPSSRFACRGSVPAPPPRSRRRARPHTTDRLGGGSWRTPGRIEASLSNLLPRRYLRCLLLLLLPLLLRCQPRRLYRQRQRRHRDYRRCPHHRRRLHHQVRLLRRLRPPSPRLPLRRPRLLLRLRRFRTWYRCYTPSRAKPRQAPSPESAQPS